MGDLYRRLQAGGGMTIIGGGAQVYDDRIECGIKGTN